MLPWISCVCSIGQEIICLFIREQSGVPRGLHCAQCGGADLLALVPKDATAWRWFFHTWQNVIHVLPWFSHTNSHYNFLSAALQSSMTLIGTVTTLCCPWNPDSKTWADTKPVKTWLNQQGSGWGLFTEFSPRVYSHFSFFLFSAETGFPKHVICEKIGFESQWVS